MKRRSINILLVDDKVSNLYALEELLKKKDRNFLKTTSGKEALKLAFNNKIHLIILDVQMPEMDGFEVAQLLKSNKRTRDIPIIFATAEKKEQRSIMRGMEEGAIDYLFKPLDPEITRAKVEVLLKIQLQKNELQEKNAILEKYQILINNCIDIICTIDAETLKFEEFNNALTQLISYSADEIKNTSLLFYIGDESRKVVEEIKNQDGILNFETQIYCKNREQKWLHWHVVVKNDKWYANARDITEIKQIEEIKNYLSTVVKQSSDAIYLHDVDGKIISWNRGAEQIYGYLEAEALQMHIWNIIPGHLYEEAKKAINDLLLGESIPSLEAKRLTKHGKMIDVLFSASIVLDSNKHLKSIAITERDITEQKLSESKIKDLNVQLQNNVLKLQMTNKDLESFSYTVSHDLRAPLRAIKGYSKILLLDYSHELQTEPIKLLNKIESNAQRMGGLIDDLLEFSRLGGKTIKKSKLDLNTLVKSVVTENSVSPNKHPGFKIANLPEISADYSLMYQVLQNLISNAVKYSGKKEKPIIEIGYREKENDFEFFIKDNGAGFNQEYADKLFQVFHRLHSTEEFEGTGVGLAIVQRIIQKHGGKVWADGEIGIGAKFHFTIPKINQENEKL